MVHRQAIPLPGLRFPDGRLLKGTLGIFLWRETGNLKGSQCRTIPGITVLGKADQPAAPFHHAAAGPGTARVVSDNRALRGLAPWSCQVVGPVKTKCVMVRRIGARKDV